MTPKRFRERVLAWYARDGRHDLPWRHTRDPYRILVSEVMLQQTQVDRVRPYYARFLERFPDVSALANAPLGDVLVAWQGLGYNRRARMLWEAARAIEERHNGKVPKEVPALEALPGIGPYTARAVAAFAYNQDVVFVETNLRTAVIHEFFKDRDLVRDTEILAVLEKAHPAGESRTWYAALMDYGAHLKRNGVRTNAKSIGYAKQSPFRGSAREVRGAILKALAQGRKERARLEAILGPDRKREVRLQIARLKEEGMLEVRGRFASLPG